MTRRLRQLPDGSFLLHPTVDPRFPVEHQTLFPSETVCQLRPPEHFYPRRLALRPLAELKQ